MHKKTTSKSSLQARQPTEAHVKVILILGKKRQMFENFGPCFNSGGKPNFAKRNKEHLSQFKDSCNIIGIDSIFFFLVISNTEFN